MNITDLKIAKYAGNTISKLVLYFLLALSLLGASQVRAQQDNNSWFGQAPPDPARSANTAPSRLERIEIPQLSLQKNTSDSEDGLLDGEGIAQTMRDIIAISQQSKTSGDQLWEE